MNSGIKVLEPIKERGYKPYPDALIMKNYFSRGEKPSVAELPDLVKRFRKVWSMGISILAIDSDSEATWSLIQDMSNSGLFHRGDVITAITTENGEKPLFWPRAYIYDHSEPRVHIYDWASEKHQRWAKNRRFDAILATNESTENIEIAQRLSIGSSLIILGTLEGSPEISQDVVSDFDRKRAIFTKALGDTACTPLVNA